MFAPDELIAALSDGGVEYVLIGGLAVGAHGFPRATKDVDIVPAPDDGNLDRLANVLRMIEAFNFGTRRALTRRHRAQAITAGAVSRVAASSSTRIGLEM